MQHSTGAMAMAVRPSDHRVEKQNNNIPDLPTNYTYTRCYCEENVYLLCQEFMTRKDVHEHWEVWAVFISNERKTVALWEQKVAREEGAPVVWDYHVILLLEAKGIGNGSAWGSRGGVGTSDRSSRNGVQSWVYDFDTAITPVPCPWDEYMMRTFPYELTPQYRSSFRLITGEVFINHFASDRSHMVSLFFRAGLLQLRPSLEEGQLSSYNSPPPTYDPICGELSRKAGITNNLMSGFVCMNPTARNTHGDVMSLEEVLFRF
ncbi:hypothetical protein P691DRAFT_722298 [Macrolepiota fuliginosa MF-IS2]|uniref:Protein N-terminal glutamine amidohydrolase n=1 Tax=Macrolepiota fuliginosa MF-IS2 TaxID=1400762 RepID=A0A9P5XM60_9AGAR|nr:hypothetical protein P691DRAFT_722298 [Macrolepiota fuliginosa MF-IS2]